MNGNSEQVISKVKMYIFNYVSPWKLKDPNSKINDDEGDGHNDIVLY